MRRRKFIALLGFACGWILSLPQMASAEDSGLITKRSKYSVPETIKRFESVIQEKGYVIFTEIDHAAAAAKFGLQSLPRTVVVYGDPKNGTARLQQFPTLAIDAPPKAWFGKTPKAWSGSRSIRPTIG
jgi:uncharacterized protein (DUF302 family)